MTVKLFNVSHDILLNLLQRELQQLRWITVRVRRGWSFLSNASKQYGLVLMGKRGRVILLKSRAVLSTRYSHT